MTDFIDAERTTVLLACLHLFEKNGRVTFREVAAGAGMPLTRTYKLMRSLKDDGYLTWEDGSKAATIRPLVEVVR